MQRKIIGVWILAIIVMGLVVESYFWFFQPKKYTGPVEKITVTTFEGGASAPIYIAESQGFFENNGLDVTIKGDVSGNDYDKAAKIH